MHEMHQKTEGSTPAVCQKAGARAHAGIIPLNNSYNTSNVLVYGAKHRFPLGNIIA